MTQTIIEKMFLRDRLRAVLLVYLEESQLDPITKKLVESLSKNFLKSTSDEEIRKIICHLRDEVIPAILDEDANHQNQQ